MSKATSPFERWLDSLRHDAEEAAAYLAIHPSGLTSFQARALVLGLFPRIERRITEITSAVAVVPELEGSAKLFRDLYDDLWRLLAPWCDPKEVAAAERRFLDGNGRPEPQGILKSKAQGLRRQSAQRGLVRDFFWPSGNGQ